MAQFTKKALVESFIKLLNDNPLDKITVKEIVDDCGVNRNTFYYYFQDIYDLLEFVFKTETQKVINDEKIYDSWKDGLLDSTKFALENKKAIYHIYNSLSREQLEKYLYDVTGNLMLAYVNQQAADIEVDEEDKEFIANFYKYALVGMILDWIGRGMKDDPSIFVEKMSKLFEGNMKSVLERVKK